MRIKTYISVTQILISSKLNISFPVNVSGVLIQFKAYMVNISFSCPASRILGQPFLNFGLEN